MGEGTQPVTVAERVAKIIKECSGVWAQSGVTSWERDRLEEWKNRQSLSHGQLAVLTDIEKKVFGS